MENNGKEFVVKVTFKDKLHKEVTYDIEVCNACDGFLNFFTTDGVSHSYNLDEIFSYTLYYKRAPQNVNY